jgi:hypothetical protein
MNDLKNAINSKNIVDKRNDVVDWNFAEYKKSVIVPKSKTKKQPEREMTIEEMEKIISRL